MAWTAYHTEVEVSAGATHTIPISFVRIRAVPYSGTGSIVTELFDGRRKQRIDGWRHEVEMRWAQLSDTDHIVVTDAIEDLINNGGTIDFDPPNNKNITLIAQNASDLFEALFDLRIRKRPAQVTLVSTTVEASPKSWINS